MRDGHVVESSSLQDYLAKAELCIIPRQKLAETCRTFHRVHSDGDWTIDIPIHLLSMGFHTHHEFYLGDAVYVSPWTVEKPCCQRIS